MNSNNPLVSIIIPTYNRGHIISETLDSIVAQTYENWECIIVDDGSTDNTDKIVEQFIKRDKRFFYYSRPKNISRGSNSCRNFGLKLSKGEFVNWFDSDDLMDSFCIEKRVILIEKGHYDFVSCELASFVNNKENCKVIKNNYEGNLLANYFCGELAFYTPGPLWSREFLLKNNLKFDLVSKVLNDWVFNINALFCTNNYYLIKEPLIYYREHQNSISGTLTKGDSNILISEFETRKLFFNIFCLKNISNKKVTDFYLKRLIFLLRGLLINKSNSSNLIFKEFLKIRHKNSFYIYHKIKITFGYITFLLFGKGYKLLTPKPNKK